jgi:nucleoside-diphosphate-sugar epimerase
MKSRILVTGAAGYIGSVLCTKLVDLGFEVVAVDILKYNQNSLSHLFFFDNFKFIKADVSRPKIIKSLLKNCDYIIPLAALVGAPLCEKFKKEAKKINVYSIKLILKYINSKQRIIYPNSNSGYGVGKKNKFCDENSTLSPVSFYGITKVQSEKLILQHKNSICFRLATIFGFSYRMRTDLLVNHFVEKCVKINKIEIFEPHFRRNYIHIRDVVNAFVFAINNFNDLRNNVYNLGLSSANITKLALAKKIQKYCQGLKIKIINNKKDPDKRDYFVSNKKIEKAGFKPSITLDTGIKELLKLFRNVKVVFKNNYENN